MRTLTGHEAAVGVLAYSPDCCRLASGDEAGLVRVWDLSSRRVEQARVAAGAVKALAFRPGTTTLAVGCDGGEATVFTTDRVLLWEPGQPARAEYLGLSAIHELVFTPDGQKLMGAGLDHGQGTVRIRWLDGHWLQRRGGFGLVLSPDGGTIATSADTGSIFLWHAPRPLDLRQADWRYKQRLSGHDRPTRVLAFVADGRSLFSALPGEVKHWDLATGLELPVRVRPPAGENPLAFSPDGRLLLTNPEEEGTLHLYETASGRLLAAFDWGMGLVQTAVFAPDGMTAAAAGPDGRVVVWDVEE
jgi:WD40 repeat protein